MREEVKYFVSYYIKAYGLDMYFQMPLEYRKKMIYSDVAWWRSNGIKIP